jgi:hypothetical protein
MDKLTLLPSATASSYPRCPHRDTIPLSARGFVAKSSNRLLQDIFSWPLSNFHCLRVLPPVAALEMSYSHFHSHLTLIGTA